MLEQEERVFHRYTPYYEGVVVVVFGERHGDGWLGLREIVLRIQQAYAFRNLSEFLLMNDYPETMALVIIYPHRKGGSR